MNGVIPKINKYMLICYLGESDLRECFRLYGNIVSARIMTDKQTGKSRGFGIFNKIN